MSTQLQEILGEFSVSVVNYTNKGIEVDHFYSEERYNDFLKGINCIQGMGLFSLDDKLAINTLDDNIVVIKQENGVETSKYKYVTIYSETIKYKNNSKNKNADSTLTFRIRKNEFGSNINFITSKESRDFDDIQDIKNYLAAEYGIFKPLDWGDFVG